MMVKTAIAALGILVGLGNTAAMAKGSPIYTVAKVAVEAEAKDAVEAKQIAINHGQQTALRTLMKRLTHASVHPRLPVLEDAMVERMIDGFSVRRESNSSTRYIATLDFSFEPNSVRNILNQFGLPYAEQQSQPIILLPVMTEAGAVKPGTNAWAQGFETVDYEHTLAGMKMSPPRPDFAPSMISNPTSPEVLQTLTQQYRSDYLVLALAEVDPARTKMRVRLIGQDSIGPISLDRTYKISGQDVDATAAFAAKVSVGIVEGRWKTTRLASMGSLDGGAIANLETVQLAVQFSGLKQWQDMRQRLQRIPGLQGLDIKSLHARGAAISVEFAGGASRLAQAAQSQGLAIDQQGGQLVLMSR